MEVFELGAFLEAFWTTIQLTVYSTVGAVIIGTALAAMRLSPVPVLNWLGTAYVNIVRNTPLTLILLLSSLGLYTSMGIALAGKDSPKFVEENNFRLAVLGLSIYTASFVCETLRSGVNTIPLGQAEAARSLGLTFGQNLTIILLPQAFRATIIPMGSVLIALTKNTTIASVIGVAEASLLMAEWVENSSALVLVGTIFAAGFVVLTLPLGLLFGWMGKRLAVAEVSGASVLFDAPGPRARIRNWIITAITVLVVLVVAWLAGSKLSDAGQFEPAKWKPFLTGNLWTTYVVPGIWSTLKAASISIVLALILGFFLGVGRMSTHAAIRWPCAVFVELFRAIPVLILMIFAYFYYSRYDVFPSEYATLAGVVTGLTLYNGAVIAEIVRAGVNALPRGQSEAASALGLRWGQTMRSILLPQAITSMLPVLVSQLVVVLKDTAIGVAITYVELLGQAQNIGASYENYIPALMVVAAIYIFVNFNLTSFATWLERRMRRSKRGPAPLEPENVEQEGAPGAKLV